ncbi:hypothetical protein AX16_009409 [Volvariella volvacea WC 439]|nr:hypothetical protein AX16_009409 [Volvariella volvacea WC 439]
MSHFSEPTIAISRRGNLTSKPRNTVTTTTIANIFNDSPSTAHLAPHSASATIPLPDWSSLLTLSPPPMEEDFGDSPELGYLGMYHATNSTSTTTANNGSTSNGNTNLKSQSPQWSWGAQHQYSTTSYPSSGPGTSTTPPDTFRHHHSSASSLRTTQTLPVEHQDHRPRSLLVQQQQQHQPGWSNIRSEQAPGPEHGASHTSAGVGTGVGTSTGSTTPTSNPHNLVIRIQQHEDDNMMAPSGPMDGNGLGSAISVKIQQPPTPTLAPLDYSTYSASSSVGSGGWRDGRGSFHRQFSQASDSSSSSDRDVTAVHDMNMRRAHAMTGTHKSAFHPNNTTSPGMSVPTTSAAVSIPTPSISTSWDPPYFDEFRYSLSSPWTPTTATSSSSTSTSPTGTAPTPHHYNPHAHHHPHSRPHSHHQNLIGPAHFSVNHPHSHAHSNSGSGAGSGASLLLPTEHIPSSGNVASSAASAASLGYNMSLQGSSKLTGHGSSSSISSSIATTTPSPISHSLPLLSSSLPPNSTYPTRSSRDIAHHTKSHSQTSSMHTQTPTPYTRPRSAESIRPETKKECSHCKATSTPLWRREPTTLKPLCNACGLYLQQRHKWRPQELIDADAEELLDDDELPSGPGSDGGSGSAGNGGGSNNGPTCSHCSARYTSVWRRSPEGAQLCNACGVYLRLRGIPRPLTLRRRKPKPRSRHSNNVNASSASGNVNVKTSQVLLADSTGPVARIK